MKRLLLLISCLLFISCSSSSTSNSNTATSKPSSVDLLNESVNRYISTKYPYWSRIGDALDETDPPYYRQFSFDVHIRKESDEKIIRLKATKLKNKSVDEYWIVTEETEVQTFINELRKMFEK